MRKKDETLRSTLLDLARTAVGRDGPDAVNIRSIAREAGIATGTVYNYFSSKDDILLALTEEYWSKALAEMRLLIQAPSFHQQLGEIYVFLQKKMQESGGLLMNSLKNVKSTGRERMQSLRLTLVTALVNRMAADPGIREDIWTDAFTPEKYAVFVIMNLMLALQSGAENIDFFVEIVKRTLY